jgi:23S rRNA U2552 (ribose-2'-O)-methylase RlmE/FtsJ
MALRLLRTSGASEQDITDEKVEDEQLIGRPPIFALDLLPLHPSVQALPGVNFIQGDFESEDVKKRLGEQVRLYRSLARDSAMDDKVDVILSDMLGEYI